ncbi:unannotated protein [freshwater metagenome]|uniref:Unannotated protein n=1 Tax=freshwater metagenome TaxID=449393 RepID=A0A6J7EE70_9ZZZZ|nr:hypothetical protein [Actinomycetota bacterium]
MTTRTRIKIALIAVIALGATPFITSPANAASTRSYDVRQDCQVQGAAQSLGDKTPNAHGNFYFVGGQCIELPS